MSTKQNVPFLKRCGLTLESLADAVSADAPRQPADQPTFSIQMLNDVRLSECSSPSIATAQGRLELVRVELRGDLLTIADIKGQVRTGESLPAEVVGARLYALRTIAMEHITIFMFLTQLPPGMTDPKFFPAEGCALMYVNAHKGQRLLKACGREKSSGQCVGFILDAIEA
jgi:hypothetical protein